MTDVRRALAFKSLVDDGFAESLPELAIRYAISHQMLSTTEIGIATIEQVQGAAAAVEKGQLSAEALSRIREIQRGFAAES